MFVNPCRTFDKNRLNLLQPETSIPPVILEEIQQIQAVNRIPVDRIADFLSSEGALRNTDFRAKLKKIEGEIFQDAE